MSFDPGTPVVLLINVGIWVVIQWLTWLANRFEDDR
jgi:hypothetical protein